MGEKKKLIEELYAKYEKYKETAEQHEFPSLMYYDVFLNAGYKDLQENYTKEHADKFINGIKIVLNRLGIEL